MFSTEFRYKLNNLRHILKKATVQLIRILFILASVATIVLMAYEYGYAISEAGKRYVTEGFNIIIRIFFFGSIATIFLDPKEIWQEKGYWIEIIVLALLLFVILTGSFSHRQLVTKNRSYPDPYSLVVYKHHPSLESGSYGITTAYKT